MNDQLGRAPLRKPLVFLLQRLRLSTRDKVEPNLLLHMSRRKTIAISIILLIVCYVLYTRPERVQRGNSVYSVVTRIDAGSGRNITVLLDDTFLEIPGWYFEINEGSQIVVPTFLLWGCCRPDVNPNFRLLSSIDHTLVGVVWGKASRCLVSCP